MMDLDKALKSMMLWACGAMLLFVALAVLAVVLRGAGVLVF